jgi:hypothetical protein
MFSNIYSEQFEYDERGADCYADDFESEPVREAASTNADPHLQEQHGSN